jgi:hypothetical protein
MAAAGYEPIGTAMAESALQDEVVAAESSLRALEDGLSAALAREATLKAASVRARLAVIAWKASLAFREAVDRLDIPRVLPVAVLPLPFVFLAFLLIAELTGLVSLAAAFAFLLLCAITTAMAFLAAFPADRVVAQEQVKAAEESKKRSRDLAACQQQAHRLRAEIGAATARLAAAREAVARDDEAKQEQVRLARLEEEMRRRSAEDRLENLYRRPWREMRADDFESFLAAVLASLGYEVEQTGQSGDQGVDLIAIKKGLRIAVQAKGYSGSVGNAAVQEAYAGISHYRCDACAVVTNSTFTSSAVSLAASTRCLLVHEANFREFVFGEIDLTDRQ